MSLTNTRIMGGVLCCLLLSTSLWSQVIEGDRYYSIESGVLTLNGTFEQLAAIEARSEGGFLSQDVFVLDGTDVEFPSTAPFNEFSLTVLSTPNNVTIGVLGRENRIDISGSTATAILYSETPDVAANGDLTVNLGLGDSPIPRQILPTAEPGMYFVDLVDGQLAINASGPISSVGGIFAHSDGLLLSLGDSRSPFGDNVVTQLNSPQSVKYGVRNVSQRIAFEGQTITSIGYSGTPEQAASDLTFALGLGFCGERPATLPFGAENAIDFIRCNPGERITEFTRNGTLPDLFYADVVDGRVTINGLIPSLGGIFIQSQTPTLSLDPVESPFDAPYIETNTQQQIKYGVADTVELLRVSGQTLTSVNYSGTNPAEDLIVEIGSAACPGGSLRLPIGVENGIKAVTCRTSDQATTFSVLGGVPGNGTLGGDGIYATVFDGRVVLNGTLSETSALSVQSLGGNLRSEGATAPFADPGVIRNNARQATYGVLDASDRISIEGVTQTSIGYTQSARTALSDLKVDILNAECGRVPASVPVGVGQAVDTLTCDGGTTNSFVSLPDSVDVIGGVVTLKGPVSNLEFIEASSQGGHLDIESEEIDGEIVLFSRPFDQANNVFLFTSPELVGIRALAVDSRVTIEGDTATSILYTQPLDIAALDLSVTISGNVDNGGGGGGPGDGFIRGFFDLVDGRVAFIGEIGGLAGITATSQNGYLSLDTLDVPGGGTVELTEPFAFGDGVVIANTPNEVTYGVLGSDNRVDLSGVTLTSIEYSGPPGAFFSDLTIQIGVGNGAPVALPVIPEPTSASLMLFGSLGLVFRKRRRSGLPRTSTWERKHPAKRSPNQTSSYFTFSLLAIGYVLAASSLTFAQGYYASIDDGAVILHGTYNQVVGLQAASTAGNLSLATTEVGESEISLRDPFSLSAAIVANEPDGRLITLGVLNAADRVDFSGSTQTAILYAGAGDDALTDLGVDVGLEICGLIPATIPIGSGASIDSLVCDGGTSLEKIGNTGVIARYPYYASVVDGQLALNGTLPDLAAISVRSNTPTLQLGSEFLPFGTSTYVEIESPQHVKFGVLDVGNRIQVAGETITSVSYSGSDPDADLTVGVGLARCGSRIGILPIGPNESSRSVACSSENQFSFFGGVREPLFASVEDGQVILNGTFPDLGGIRARSQNAHLDLASENFPFGEDAFVNVKSSNEVKFGVADRASRVDLQGRTVTSLQYSGPLDQAADDLSIELGLGDCGVRPMHLPIGEDTPLRSISCNPNAIAFSSIGGVPGNGTVGGDGLYATIVDDRIVLNGDFENLSGMEVRSAEGHLLTRSDPAPFAYLNPNTRTVMSLGILDSDERITVSGVTQTGVGYRETIRTAVDDLTIDLRLEACGSGLASLPVGIDSAIQELTCDGGTTEASNRLPSFAGVEDGALVITGEFEGVHRINATSLGGHLALESVERNGAVALFKKPFSQAKNMNISVTPERVTLSVLDTDDRVNLAGRTVTSILYSEAEDIAAVDLDVDIDYLRIPVDIPGDGSVSLVDGHITLDGTFTGLVGIEATSEGGHLSLDSIELAPGLVLQRTQPFPNGIVVSNLPSNVTIGVLGAANRVDIEGTTQTSIVYSGPADDFFSDVTIQLGFGDSPPVIIESLSVPEPSSNLFGLAGVCAVSMLRGRRWRRKSI